MGYYRTNCWLLHLSLELCFNLQQHCTSHSTIAAVTAADLQNRDCKYCRSVLIKIFEFNFAAITAWAGLSYTVQTIHIQCIETEDWVHFKIDWSIQMFSQNSFNHWFLFSTKKSGWVTDQLEREETLSFTTTKEWKLFSELHHTAKLLSENWNLITRGFVSLDSLKFLSVNSKLDNQAPLIYRKESTERQRAFLGKFRRYGESVYDETSLRFVEKVHFDFSQAFRCQSMWKNPLLCIWIFEWTATSFIWLTLQL